MLVHAYAVEEFRMGALSRFRICDFTGQLAGAGATKWLASFGAEVIRIEDPVRQGRWDILRGIDPFVDDRRGVDMGGGFNNHNTDKQGITLNIRTEKGKALLAELVKRSDVVTENFAAGVLESWGFGYEKLKALKPNIIYVSNCGFGHVGPYRKFKTWGPIVQAVSGLTFTSALPGQPPAGWGYSYMDHTGGYYMAMAIMLALIHRERTGEGQWVDLACTEAALTLHGPALLDWTVNGRSLRRDGSPNSNRNQWPAMAPHGIYPCAGDDEWVAIACRDDADWSSLCAAIDQRWSRRSGFRRRGGTPCFGRSPRCDRWRVDPRARQIRRGTRAARRRCTGRGGVATAGTHRSRRQHGRVRAVAHRHTHEDGSRPRRWSTGAFLRH